MGRTPCILLMAARTMVIIFQANIRSVHKTEWKMLIDKSWRCCDERRQSLRVWNPWRAWQLNLNALFPVYRTRPSGWTSVYFLSVYLVLVLCFATHVSVVILNFECSFTVYEQFYLIPNSNGHLHLYMYRRQVIQLLVLTWVTKKYDSLVLNSIYQI